MLSPALSSKAWVQVSHYRDLWLTGRFYEHSLNALSVLVLVTSLSDHGTVQVVSHRNTVPSV